LNAFRSLPGRARAAFDAEGDTPAAVALRAGRRYVEDDMPNRAASLAYFGILSLFPSLLIGFGVLRLVGGDDAPGELSSFASEHGASGALADTLRSAVETAEGARSSSASLIGVVGVATLLYQGGSAP
jgi:membrane protein